MQGLATSAGGKRKVLLTLNINVGVTVFARSASLALSKSSHGTLPALILFNKKDELACSGSRNLKKTEYRERSAAHSAATLPFPIRKISRNQLAVTHYCLEYAFSTSLNGAFCIQYRPCVVVNCGVSESR